MHICQYILIASFRHSKTYMLVFEVYLIGEKATSKLYWIHRVEDESLFAQ